MTIARMRKNLEYHAGFTHCPPVISTAGPSPSPAPPSLPCSPISRTHWSRPSSRAGPWPIFAAILTQPSSATAGSTAASTAGAPAWSSIATCARPEWPGSGSRSSDSSGLYPTCSTWRSATSTPAPSTAPGTTPSSPWTTPGGAATTHPTAGATAVPSSSSPGIRSVVAAWKSASRPRYHPNPAARRRPRRWRGPARRAGARGHRPRLGTQRRPVLARRRPRPRPQARRPPYRHPCPGPRRHRAPLRCGPADSWRWWLETVAAAATPTP